MTMRNRPRGKLGSAESVPGFDLFSWFGFFVPARTPQEVIARINADTNAAVVYP
jgi:tripartite-type tricarboxylate transporter receptor subunit TctC